MIFNILYGLTLFMVVPILVIWFIVKEYMNSKKTPEIFLIIIGVSFFILGHYSLFLLGFGLASYIIATIIKKRTISNVGKNL